MSKFLDAREQAEADERTPAPQGETGAQSLEREFYAQARHDNIHWSDFCAQKLRVIREERDHWKEVAKAWEKDADASNENAEAQRESRKQAEAALREGCLLLDSVRDEMEMADFDPDDEDTVYGKIITFLEAHPPASIPQEPAGRESGK